MQQKYAKIIILILMILWLSSLYVSNRYTNYLNDTRIRAALHYGQIQTIDGQYYILLPVVFNQGKA